MRLGIPVRTSAIWVILVLAGLVSWWLGTNDSGDQPRDRVMIGAVIVIAFVKAYLIGMEFMEVRCAPALLRGLLTGWVGSLTIAITTLYFAP